MTVIKTKKKKKKPPKTEDASATAALPDRTIIATGDKTDNINTTIFRRSPNRIDYHRRHYYYYCRNSRFGRITIIEGTIRVIIFVVRRTDEKKMSDSASPDKPSTVFDTNNIIKLAVVDLSLPVKEEKKAESGGCILYYRSYRSYCYY